MLSVNLSIRGDEEGELMSDGLNRIRNGLSGIGRSGRSLSRVYRLTLAPLAANWVRITSAVGIEDTASRLS
jgi:hypothetical protein